MAALTAITPTNTGATAAPAAVAASDTISTAVMGRDGCYLLINNGNGSTDNVTISDAGVTPSGNSPGTVAGSLATTVSKVFRIRRDQASPSTGLVTVTHSVTSSVTYQLFPVD